jgi:hypothetical protein
MCFPLGYVLSFGMSSPGQRPTATSMVVVLSQLRTRANATAATGPGCEGRHAARVMMPTDYDGVVATGMIRCSVCRHAVAASGTCSACCLAGQQHSALPGSM